MLSRRILLDVANQIVPKNNKGVEIGVWKGEFASEILEVLQPSKLYLCDPWQFTPQHPDRWYGGSQAKSQQDMDEIYQSVISRFQDKGQVEIIRDYSRTLPIYITPGSLDWTYIDGDHSRLAVLEDLNTSLTLVRSGGLIMGDDLAVGNDVESALLSFINTHHSLVEGFYQKERQFLIKINKGNEQTN